MHQLDSRAETHATRATQATEDLIRVFRQLRARLRTQSAAGLTPSQTSVLLRLQKDGPSTTTLLAMAEQVRSPSMTALLNALDDRDLIQRQPDPEDGRRQLISLTTQGSELVDRDRDTRYAQLATAMQDRFSPAELTTITQALTLLSGLIEDDRS